MTTPKTFEYPAIEIKQNNSAKPFYMLSCSAKTLLQWSGVPRKEKEFYVGYQRTLNEGRLNEIKNFFLHNEKTNVIPTTILVAMKENTFSFAEASQKCTITLPEYSEEEKLSYVLKELEDRLGREPTNKPQYRPLSAEEKEFSGDTSDIFENQKFDSYIVQIILRIKAILKKRKGDLDQDDKNLINYINDYVKPGLILDGQHRALGAKSVEDFQVNLPVIVMPDLSPVEQVFHFFIVNNKAKPLNKTELRQVLSTSITDNEFETLKERFIQSGIKTTDYYFSTRMDNDEDSPFKDLINFSQKKQIGKPIKESVANDLCVQFFKKLNTDYNDFIEKNQNWNNSNDGKKQDEFRLSIFYGFWEGVRGTYPNTWVKGSDNTKDINWQIFMKISLTSLQTFILRQMWIQFGMYEKLRIDPFSTPTKMTECVKDIIKDLSKNFFIKEWKVKSLNHDAGRKLFEESLTSAFNKKEKFQAKTKLFKG